jgi:hypothetical protein
MPAARMAAMNSARLVRSGNTTWNMCQFELSKSGGRELAALPFNQHPIEAVEIAAREGSAPEREFLEARQLAEADARRDVGEVEFAAEHVDVHAVFAGAGHPLKPQLLAQRHVVFAGHHDAAAFRSGDVLVGVKAECDQVAPGADARAAPGRSECLRRVLEHAQAMLHRDCVQAVEIHRSPAR